MKSRLARLFSSAVLLLAVGVLLHLSACGDDDGAASTASAGAAATNGSSSSTSTSAGGAGPCVPSCTGKMPGDADGCGGTCEGCLNLGECAPPFGYPDAASGACVCARGYTGEKCNQCDTAGGYVERDACCVPTGPCTPNPCKEGEVCDTPEGTTHVCLTVCKEGEVRAGDCESQHEKGTCFTPEPCANSGEVYNPAKCACDCPKNQIREDPSDATSACVGLLQLTTSNDKEPWKNYAVCRNGGDAASCSLHGDCDAATELCVCDAGWEGNDCSTPSDGTWDFSEVGKGELAIALPQSATATNYGELGSENMAAGPCIGGQNYKYPYWRLINNLPTSGTPSTLTPDGRITGVTAPNPSIYGARLVDYSYPHHFTPVGNSGGGIGCGQCYQVSKKQADDSVRTANIVIVDRCAGYCKCDLENPDKMQECGECVQKAETTPGNPATLTNDDVTYTANVCLKYYDAGKDTTYMDDAGHCDWCAQNVAPHFDLDNATFNYLCPDAGGGACWLDDYKGISCGAIGGPWPNNDEPGYQVKQ